MRKITQAAYNTVAAGGKAKSLPGGKFKGKGGPRYDNIIDALYDQLGPSAEVSGTNDYEKLVANGITLKYYPEDDTCEVTGKDTKLVRKVKDFIGDISDLSSINGPDNRTVDAIIDLLSGSVQYDEGWYGITSGGKAKSLQAVVYFNGKDQCIVYAGEKISTRWYDLGSIARTLGGVVTKLKTKDDALMYIRNVAHSRTNTSAL